MWQNLMLVDILALSAIGTWMSIIGGLKQMRTNSPSEGILLIVVGACIVSLSGLMASLASRLLGQ
jgi:uncharacterized sodium:solute symporter family permease YidK